MKSIIKKNLFPFLCIFMTLSMFLSGCSTTNTSAANPDVSTLITVTDGLGRQIQLKKPAERVLTNYTIPSHMLFALGAGDKLLAADGGTSSSPLFKSLVPSITNIKDFKNKKSFNVEEALALKPDLVLLNSSCKDIISDAEKHGIQVFAVQAEDINQLKTTMENLGKALGKEKEAKDFCDYYDTVIENIKKGAEGIKDSEKPTVYIAGSDLYSTASKDMYQNSIIELAGGKNVGSELSGGWVKVSTEQIIKWNPDVILLTQYCGVKPEDVLNNPSFQSINAVKNKKVYLFPSKLCAWDFPSPQAVLGIEWIASKINPEVFNNYDMNKEADKFFNKFYGKSFSEFGENIN